MVPEGQGSDQGGTPSCPARGADAMLVDLLERQRFASSPPRPPVFSEAETLAIAVGMADVRAGLARAWPLRLLAAPWRVNALADPRLDALRRLIIRLHRRSHVAVPDLLDRAAASDLSPRQLVTLVRRFSPPPRQR
jgi:hypothetical protein